MTEKSTQEDSFFSKNVCFSFQKYFIEKLVCKKSYKVLQLLGKKKFWFPK
jgi:hypothetical protein